MTDQAEQIVAAQGGDAAEDSSTEGRGLRSTIDHLAKQLDLLIRNAGVQAPDTSDLSLRNQLEAMTRQAEQIAHFLGYGHEDGSATERQGLRSTVDHLAKQLGQVAEKAGVKPIPLPQPPVSEPGQAIVNSVGMEMVEIPAGEYLRGSSEEDIATLRREAEAMLDMVRKQNPEAQLPWIDLWLKHLDNEGPQHRVRISQPFLMGSREVTVGQFQQFVNETGYITECERSQETGIQSYGLDLTTGWVEPREYYNWRFWLREDKTNPSGFEQTDDHPVVCVSWNDAQAFCKWLSNKEGRTYRLPTEAEWEYACRANTKGRYSFGDASGDLQHYGNTADRSLQKRWKLTLPTGDRIDAPPYAQGFDDQVAFTAAVGQYKPNPWGLYDMHGNAGEWCLDWYAPYGDFVQPDTVLVDPLYDPAHPEPVDISDVIQGADPRPLRMLRSGVWLDPDFGFRSADRETHRRHPVDSAADIGFRVVCSETPLQRIPLTTTTISRVGEGKALDDMGNFHAQIVASQSDGKCFVFSATLPGDHPGVPLHLHEEELEILQVVSGEFIVEYGDPKDPHDKTRLQRGIFGPGDIAAFPPMTPHGFRTASTSKTDTATALIIVAPAGLEDLYEEARGLSAMDFVKLGIEKYGMVTLGPPPMPEEETPKKPRPRSTARKAPSKTAATRTKKPPAKN